MDAGNGMSCVGVTTLTSRGWERITTAYIPLRAFRRLNETTLEKRKRKDKTLKSDDYAKILIVRQNDRVSPFADCERETCGMGKWI